MFGILFPVSLFLSFVIGRNIPVDRAIPVLVAQTLFFASSSIGDKTIAGFIYGMMISVIPIMIGVGLFQSQITSLPDLTAGMILSALVFAAMGITFASLPGQGPGQVMMPLNFVRIPLLFVSGVFIPIEDLPAWGQNISLFSPLTHGVELVRSGLGESFYGIPVNVAVLSLYLAIFLFVGIRFHILNQKKE